MAVNAEPTSHRGPGYEFRYNQTSRGIQGAGETSGMADVEAADATPGAEGPELKRSVLEGMAANMLAVQKIDEAEASRRKAEAAATARPAPRKDPAAAAAPARRSTRTGGGGGGDGAAPPAASPAVAAAQDGDVG